MIGTKIVITITILICLIFLNSCSTNIEVYQFNIKNHYFEPLYNTKIGEIVFDTIFVNESTPTEIINQGNYIFTSETQSGLFLESAINFQGNKGFLKLVINKNGKLTIE